MIGNEELEYAVIGKFSYGWPDIQELRKIIPKQCELKRNVNIGLLCNRPVLIRASRMEDYVNLLPNPSFYIVIRIGTTLCELFKWDPLFDPMEETSIEIAWILLPALPPNSGQMGYRQLQGHNEKECFVLHIELYPREEMIGEADDEVANSKGEAMTIKKKEVINKEKVTENNFQESKIKTG
ncbi:hypothetical protein H5410_060660 [Solanum commersonii]|uniref:DUF4283 domain-containing protein n=1 Tax=Solanum commersonii TaxID=4109 RepID=A0A9J5W784_SOLCO|nr:hypothetical protein H5410_060660 [Solanum commersonii]